LILCLALLGFLSRQSEVIINEANVSAEKLTRAQTQSQRGAAHVQTAISSKLDKKFILDGPFRLPLTEAGFAGCYLFCNTDVLLEAPDNTWCVCQADGNTCGDYSAECRDTPQKKKSPPDYSSVSSVQFPLLHNGPEKTILDIVTVVQADVKLSALVAWLEWLRFAGAGYFHVYDCSASVTSQPGPLELSLRPLVSEGFVFYTRWKQHCTTFPSSWASSQIAAWADVTEQHGAGTSAWRAMLEVGLVPVLTNEEHHPGFLAKYLLDVSTAVGVVYFQAHKGSTTRSQYCSRLSHANGFGIYKGGSVLKESHSEALVFKLGDPEAFMGREAANVLQEMSLKETLFAGVPSFQLVAGVRNPGTGIVARVAPPATAESFAAIAKGSISGVKETRVVSGFAVEGAKVWPP
jgi:hypothetical protein